MEKLSSLKVGEKAQIKSFESKTKTRNILLSFGLYHDAIVELIRTASFSDPMCLRLNNRLLAIRKMQADKIFIQKL